MQPLPGKDKYFFVFVRQDLTLPQQMVQSNHASHSIASQFPVDGVPNIVVIGVPNKAGLEEVIHILNWFQYPYCAFMEPDEGLGLTAVATVPLDGNQKMVFRDFKLWIPISPCSSDAERLSAHKADRRSETRNLPGAPECAISLEA